MSNFALMIYRIITTIFFVCVYCSSSIYAQSAIELFDGASVNVPSNSNGTKYINFTIRNVIFSDSTSNECKLDYDVVVSSIGQKTKIGEYENPLFVQDYFFGWREENSNVQSRFLDKTEIAKNDSIVNHQSTKLYNNDHRRKIIYYKNTPLFIIPHYDGSVYAEKARLERERIYLAEKAHRDSIANAVAQEQRKYAERQQMLLTPEYYTNWIGATFFTISSIENDLDVRPIRIINETNFYEFESCFVGMRANEKGVITQMTFRLYGDVAEDFLQKALDYGYKVSGKGTNVNVRTNSGKLLPDLYDTKVIQYSKATNNGKVLLEVANSPRYAGEYEIAIFRAR